MKPMAWARAVFAFLVKIGIGLVRSYDDAGSVRKPAPGQPAAAGRRKARRQVRPFACQQPAWQIEFILRTASRAARMTFSESTAPSLARVSAIEPAKRFDILGRVAKIGPQLFRVPAGYVRPGLCAPCPPWVARG